MPPITLYGAPISLYTGKVRSYLRKQAVDFVEVSPGSERFVDSIVPAVGRWIIPVIETAEGRIVQDGADIIDHLERSGSRYPAYPTTPVHRALSHVFELFGGEGLLRPAMHYRWSFDERNLSFLQHEFASGLAPTMPAEAFEAFFATASGRMRRAAAGFGVSAESAPLIEAAFHEWLTLFDDHLVDHPYLLGDRPTLGDYCLMGPMWAHLFHDPEPTLLVKQHTPRVGRWVERMSAPEDSYPERQEAGHEPDLIPDDGVPATLAAMLRFVSEEYLPEISAHVAYANDWLAGRPEIEAGTNGLENPASRGIGSVELEWRGTTIRTGVMPYRFWLMQRLHDAVETFDGDARARVRSLFRSVDLEPLLDLRTARRVERNDHLEVWGP